MAKGSCHCGKVRYEVAAIDDMWHCHCQTCRKTHAAQRNTAAKVERTNFHVISGAAGLSSYQSIPGKLRHFCGTCGCHIYAEFPERSFVVLRAATLDDDPGIRASRSVWLSHDLPWLDESSGTPQFSEAPSA